MYNVLDVANYIVNYAIDQRKPVSNLTLQKILYYVQAGFLVEREERLFGEPIVCWRYGPVVEKVYNNFRVYGNSRITEKIDKKLEFNIDTFDFEEVDCNPIELIESKDVNLINKIVSDNLDFGAFELVERTHSELPWDMTLINNEISIYNIKAYFGRNRERIYGQ